MESRTQNPFSGPVTVFQDRRLPEEAVPVGYAALVGAHALHVPLPRTLSAIGPRHRLYEADGWAIYTPRHAPTPDIEGNLTFALKYEGLDLAVLKSLFRAIGPAPIEAMVRAARSCPAAWCNKPPLITVFAGLAGLVRSPQLAARRWDYRLMGRLFPASCSELFAPPIRRSVPAG